MSRDNILIEALEEIAKRDEATERILDYCINNKVSPGFIDFITGMLDEKNKNQFVYEKFEQQLLRIDIKDSGTTRSITWGASPEPLD